MDPTKGDQSNTKACHGNCKYQPYILSCALQREYEEENCFNVFILPKQTSAKKRKKYVDFGTPPFHLGFPKSKATVFFSNYALHLYPVSYLEYLTNSISLRITRRNSSAIFEMFQMICSCIPGLLIFTETSRQIQQTNANKLKSKQANKLTS